MAGYLILDTTPLLAAAVSGLADQFLPNNNGGKTLVIPQDVINEINTGYSSGAAAQAWLQANSNSYLIAPATLPPGTKNAGENGIGQYIKNNMSDQDVTVLSENPRDWQNYINAPAQQAGVNSLDIETTTGYLSDQILSGRSSYADVVPNFDRVVSVGGLQLNADPNIPNIFGPNSTGQPGQRSIDSTMLPIVDSDGNRVGTIQFPGLGSGNLNIDYYNNQRSAVYIEPDGRFSLGRSGGPNTGTITTQINEQSSFIGPTDGPLGVFDRIAPMLGLPSINGEPTGQGTLTIHSDGSMDFSRESSLGYQIFGSVDLSGQIGVHASDQGGDHYYLSSDTSGNNYYFTFANANGQNYTVNTSQPENGGSITDVSGQGYQLHFDGADIHFSSGSTGKLIGDFDNVTAGNASNIVLSGQNSTITATYASLNLGPGSSANVSGQGDTIILQGNTGTYAGVYGQNQTVTGDSGSNSINLGGDGTSATVYGTNGVGGYVGLVGNDQSLTLGNWGFTVATASSVQGENIGGDNSSITLGSGASANIWGSNDTLGMAGSNSFAGIQGTGETIANNDTSNLVNINGNGSSATVNGDVGIGLYGSNQSVTLNSSGDHATVYGGFTGEGINASQDTIALGGNASANVFGSSDTINLASNAGAYAGIFGQNQTVTGDSGSNSVNLGGNGTSATVDGGGYVGLCDSNQTLTLGNTGSSVQTAMGVQGDTVYGSGATVSYAANTSGNVSGTNDVIDLQGNGGDHLGVSGQNQVVNGDSGNDGVNLGGNNTSATVNGGGCVGLINNNETLTLGTNGSTVLTAPDITGETIDGSHDAITFANNVIATVNGWFDTIQAYAGHDSLVINGGYDQFAGTSDTVNFDDGIAGDTVAGGGDSYYDDGRYYGGSNGYGTYEGDPWGGGGGGDGDGDDDGDPLVLNLDHGAVQTVGVDQSPAAFDMQNDGQTVRTGWGTPGEGYLVDDAGGQDTVTKAADLVPSFFALQALDTNHDGVLDAKDAAWGDLKVWVDTTGTAAFQPGSLQSLGDLGIVSIDLNATPDRHGDNGNTILADSSFTFADGSTGDMADVAFHFAAAVTAGGQTAGASGTAQSGINADAAAQATQLAAAMSSFGASPAAETLTPTSPLPAQATVTADATSYHKLAA